MTFPLNRPRGPQSERMLAVLDAVAALQRATSIQVAERCGLTVAQAGVCLAKWKDADRVKHVGYQHRERQPALVVWGMA